VLGNLPSSIWLAYRSSELIVVWRRYNQLNPDMKHPIYSTVPLSSSPSLVLVCPLTPLYPDM
jgi:hypothetical protein